MKKTYSKFFRQIKILYLFQKTFSIAPDLSNPILKNKHVYEESMLTIKLKTSIGHSNRDRGALNDWF